MTMPFQCCCGNKFVTLMCCSDDVILGIGIGIWYWYRWRPMVLGYCGYCVVLWTVPNLILLTVKVLGILKAKLMAGCPA